MSRALWTASMLMLLTSTAAPQARHREELPVLLGVVTAPAEKKGLEVLYVLPKSPAARAGIEAGDRLLETAGEKLSDPLELDDALRDVKPGGEVKVAWKRKENTLQAEVQLMARGKYKGDFLKRRGRGGTGFEAPPWYAFAWGNLDSDELPPTLESTRGKIVVIHAFQGW